jgi:hypothetical protein
LNVFTDHIQGLASYNLDLVAARGDHDALVNAYRAVISEALRAQQAGIVDMRDAAGQAIASYDSLNAGIMLVRRAACLTTIF